MVAGFLLVLVIVELVFTVWTFTRWQGVRRELQLMGRHYDDLSDALRDAAKSAGVPVEVGASDELRSDDVMNAASATLSNASPEQLEAASKLLDSLGIGKE